MPFTADWIEEENCKCVFCGDTKVSYIKWESNDEAYEDYKYHCDGCGKSWWVEGIDA